MKNYSKETTYSRALNLMSEFSKALNDVQISHDFPNIINSIILCEGKIITTGMGKAGIAMRKFASTLCSLGFPSCYLHPGEASHGDLGLISPTDILFVASTSGKTKEIISIMKMARKINVKKMIGITSHIDSFIRKEADYIVDMGVIKENGHLHIAPTTSILVMIALTDTIALLAAEAKGFTLNEYGRYHHSGYLGSLARQDDEIY